MTKIADYAYMRNFSLEEALIPRNVVEIGNNAFFMCTNLKTLKMQNVKSVGINAFYGCIALKDIDFGNALTTIKIESFHRCTSIEKLQFPDSIESIEPMAFYACKSLKEICFGKSLSNIGYEAFDLCPVLEKITMPRQLFSNLQTKFTAIFGKPSNSIQLDLYG